MHHSGLSQRYIIQDLALPISTSTEFIEWTNTETGIYPLWLCPLLPSEDSFFHPHAIDPERKSELLLNVGVWGPGPADHKEFIALNRKIEDQVRKNGGCKWFYAQFYDSEEEFWQVYDKAAYVALREKFDASSLPEVYDKVKVETIPEERKGWRSKRPFGGWYGVYKATLGSDYLLRKK